MIERVTRTVSTTKSTRLDGDENEYECDMCKDEEWIFDKGNNSARPCTCREKKIYERILEHSGISDSFLSKNFNNYKPHSEYTNKALATAKHYISVFKDIKGTKNNSLALLGQVGSGKTHLTIAVANELMKKNIGVRYMQYREEMPLIKQVVNDQEAYIKTINQYKNATVLLIDDLYKNAIGKGRFGEYLNDADKRVMFEIINHRSFNSKPMIISSECNFNQILNLDEGIGSRLFEMCKGHIAEIEGIENNYRLRR